VTRSLVNAAQAVDLRADVHRLASVALLAEAATVSDVDTSRRMITGRIVPYGEPGRTNLGHGLAVRAGAVRFRGGDPAAVRVIGTYGHDRERTVSRLAGYEDRPDGLWGRFRVASTPLGDQLLAEAAEGVRSMLSIELDGCTVDPAAFTITDGLCEFVAHVPIGAYDSARVDSVAAALHPGNGADVPRLNHSPFARSAFGREFITVGGGQPAAPAAPAAAPAAQPAAAAPAVPAAPVAPAVPAQAAQPSLTATAAPAPAPTLDAGPGGRVPAADRRRRHPAGRASRPVPAGGPDRGRGRRRPVHRRRSGRAGAHRPAGGIRGPAPGPAAGGPGRRATPAATCARR
jgi:hypothetical protein